MVRPKEVCQAMKSLKYIFKFVVRSRSLFATLNGGRGKDPFQQMPKDVLHSLVKLMTLTMQDLHQVRFVF